MGLTRAYLLEELQWIQSAGDCPQSGFRGLWETLSLQQPLTGRLRRMVALGHVSALTVLLRELEGGLEEVHEQTRCAVQSRDGLRGGEALKTTVAEQPAHNSAVLLLNPGLIVLAPGTGARELDPMAEAILDEGLVHKLTAVINVQRAKCKRKSRANPIVV